MTIDYLPLRRITAMHADEIHEAIGRVVDAGWYLHGEATQRFEQHYADYIGTRHCIGVGNGLDALTLMLRAYKELGVLHEGDEVIVPANTFIATILAITENRLTPILVEPDAQTLQLDERLVERAITPRTRAIMLVHLYGRPAYTPMMAVLCHRYSLLLLEDNAQAHGCRLERLPGGGLPGLPLPQRPNADTHADFRRTGALGHAAAHSFYPGKNLGALGDGGAVTTCDDRLAAMVRSLANYGSERKYVFGHVGRNSRLDEVQAAVLDVKLKYLDQDNARRRQIADTYIHRVKNPLLRLPTPSESVYHIFPVLCERRDALQHYLEQNGVGTVIHYPIPPHRQACYAEWNHLSLPVTEMISRQELSLPCHQAMAEEEVERMVDLLNSFS